MIWSFALAIVGLTGIWLAGKKNAWGWAIGSFAQIMWIAFALITAQYGFILTAVAYGYMYGKNFYSWKHLEKAEKGCD